MSCAPGVGPAGRLLPAQARRHLRTLVTWGRPELHFDAVAEFRQRLRQLAVALDLLGRPVDRDDVPAWVSRSGGQLRSGASNLRPTRTPPSTAPTAATPL